MAIDDPARLSSGSFPAGGVRRLATGLIQAITIHLGWDFLFFLLFGGIAAAVNLAVGALLYGVPAIAAMCPYWLAVTLGASSGLLVNFYLNYHYNFRFRGRSALAQLRTFCVVAVVGIGLTALFSSALLALLHASGLSTLLARPGLPVTEDFLAHVGAVALVTFYSYAAHKCFTFNVGIRRRVRSLLVYLEG